MSVSDSIARKMILSLVHSVPELSRERAFSLFYEIFILSCGGAEAWCSEGEYVSFDGAYSVDVRLKQMGMPSSGYQVFDADRKARKIPVTLSRVCLQTSNISTGDDGWDVCSTSRNLERACATGNVAALVPTSLTAIPDLVNWIRKPLAFSHLPALTGAIEKAMPQFGLKFQPVPCDHWTMINWSTVRSPYYHLVI